MNISLKLHSYVAILYSFSIFSLLQLGNTALSLTPGPSINYGPYVTNVTTLDFGQNWVATHNQVSSAHTVKYYLNGVLNTSSNYSETTPMPISVIIGFRNPQDAIFYHSSIGSGMMFGYTYKLGDTTYRQSWASIFKSYVYTHDSNTNKVYILFTSKDGNVVYWLQANSSITIWPLNTNYTLPTSQLTF